jgi:glycosyltransferase involved in cell wall biosynthesis
MPESPPTDVPPVSIVVPCYNAAATLDALLATLTDQDFGGPSEVLVVDNASTDGTSARAQEWAKKLPNLRVLSASARQGCGYARNVGIAAASHEFVLSCDADDVVDRSWVRKMVETLEHSDVVGGGLVEWQGGRVPEPAAPEPFGRAGFGFLPSFCGCNFGLHKTAWMALGGFDEDLVSCEDLDLAWRAQLEGLRLVTRVDAFVYHRVPVRPIDTFRKLLFYGTYQPLLFAKFRRRAMARQPVHRALARWLILLATSYRLVLGGNESRRRWCAEAGRRIGRAIGSIRFRSLYL